MLPVARLLDLFLMAVRTVSFALAMSLILAAALLTTTGARAAPATTLPGKLDAQLSEWGLDISQVSVYVRAVDAEEPRLLVNPETPRVPASVIKLLTSIAGLDILGPNYHWATDVYVDGRVVGGQLQGNLYIQGYGDPYLTADAFAGILRALRVKGLIAIEGDVVLDNSFLAPPEQERGDFDGAAQRSYNALPSALSVNRQVTDIHIYRDWVNNGVGVYTEPPLTGVEIVNEARLVDAPCARRYHNPIATFIPATETAGPKLRISGTFADECGEEQVGRLLLTPEQHAAAAVDALWRDLGGSIGGKIRLGKVPKGARQFHRALSQPLGVIIRDIDKNSNNLMARMLFLTLGASEKGAPGTLEKSRDTINAWLNKRGLPMPELVADNGSGLSRETRISAGSLGELLSWSYRQPWMPELLASMSIAGVDGTTRRRLRREPIAGRAHLKTGTVRDASCIAGYVLDRNDRRWIVAVLVNGQDGQALGAWRGHAVHHEILRWVYRGAPLPTDSGD
ncbi:D-alanyl-D-alanine carboxypeptidase, serine-type, PBP4 family [Thiorhodovibrio frisius]|uniref:D-alanyl-D-alanine carboxypeptidase, serine-type, PBP4 family n=2 Tax=Thiorhodovibrio frisius TaxID=631362 RepID=H8Z2U9_9GAMM|nr:D-alanyl-D-alanine carboxypeptidase, serine-type, PBP4 family [Thiorhodovibrio frisius]WPL21653.1 D-alanyl-D-alanine carboxypeptidase DacC precursor [Thiorhodovibrio frisius]